MQAITLSPGLYAAVKNLKEANARTELQVATVLPASSGLNEAERKHFGFALKDKKEPISAWY
jgi:hypothetical protein